MADKVKIIAEIGECWNGDITAAKKLIRVAKKAGCDYAKFQTLDRDAIKDDDPEREWFRKIALDRDMVKEFTGYARKAGIDILFSPENVKTAKWLKAAGLDSVKIASSVMYDKELLRYVNGAFGEVFISTGMATLKEVVAAVRILGDVEELYILHCVSEYPTGPLLEKRGLKALSEEDVRLNMVGILKRSFPDRVIGYSDHTSGILAPVLAVAAGAKVIEKHITLDRSRPMNNYKKGLKYMGTDHVLSLEPDELKLMVERIREAERMMGGEGWERSKGEKILRKFLISRFK